MVAKQRNDEKDAKQQLRKRVNNNAGNYKLCGCGRVSVLSVSSACAQLRAQWLIHVDGTATVQ